MSDTRDELLDSTGTVLAREGYAGFTTAKVAEEAGVSHPAVHYHFDTKEGLLVAYVESYTEQWLERLETTAGADAGERLEAVLRLLVDGLGDEEMAGGTLALLELHARAPHVDALREALAALDRRTTAFVASLVESGVEEGVFHEADPEATAELLLAAADGAALRQHTIDGDAATVLTAGVVDHVLDDLYVGDAPDLGGGA